jgi:tRNA pseudouridine55 synthase
VKKIIVLHKKEGETPLEALENFRRKNKEYKDAKMTYAGRLDPMASGLLLVLAGEEVKNKEKYLVLDKEYEFEILFGFATDTYDILGKIIKNTEVKPMYFNRKSDLQKKVKENLKYFTGKFVQKYPMYSSKTVKGRQLFEYARAGTDVERPEREVFVKELKLLKLRKISNKKLLANIEKRIKKVKGDFRQKEILKIWRKKLKRLQPKKPQDFFIASLKIKCGSGTYVRSIGNSLGEWMGIPALAFSIKRTRIGNFR